jgi:hypothetical protein
MLSFQPLVYSYLSLSKKLCPPCIYCNVIPKQKDCEKLNISLREETRSIHRMFVSKYRMVDQYEGDRTILKMAFLKLF